MTPTRALVHNPNTDYQVPSGADLDKVTVRMPYRLLYCAHASLKVVTRTSVSFQRWLAGIEPVHYHIFKNFPTCTTDNGAFTIKFLRGTAERK